MNLFNGTIQQLEHSLDYATTRNNTISNNISNVDTPRYKAKDTVFKNALSDAMNKSIHAKQTHQKHIPFNNEQTKFNTITKKNTTYNNNGNNVDVDKEMTELAKNQIYYQALVDRLSGKFGSLQTVIRGGS